MNQRKAGVILSYLLTATNTIVGFIYIPILIYFLGQGEYGLYQLMGSFLVYLGLFDFGLSNTVTRYYSKYLALKDEKGKENILALSSIIYGLLTILLIIIGIILYFKLNQIFSSSFTESEIIIAKKMYIVILFTVAITISTSVFNSIITSHERFVFLRVLSIVQTILRPVVVFAIFTVEANALIVVIVQAIINILGIVFKISYSFKKLNVKIKLHFWDMPLFKEMIRYSFFIFITAVMDQIFWRSDQLILGIVIGTGAVAVYSIGSQIIMIYVTLSTAMSGIFLPSITKKVTEKISNNELSKIFIRIGRIQFILLGAILTGFVLFGEEFIFIWVGEGFSQAYFITLIIMFPFTIDLIQNIGLAILQAKNMYGFRAVVFFIMSLINVIVSIPLAIKYGGIGAAAATGISYLIGNGLIMNIYYYKKVHLNIPAFWKEMGRLSLPIILVFAIGFFIKKIDLGTPIFSFVFLIILYITIYIIIMWTFAMNKYEKSLILEPLKKVIKRFI